MSKTNGIMYHLLTHAVADINLAAACFYLIQNSPPEDQSRMAEDFFIRCKAAASDESIQLPVFISEEEKNKYTNSYSRLIDTYIEELEKNQPSEQEYYHLLWTFIRDNPVLPNEKARAVALYRCACDRRLPYFRLDKDQMLSMDQEEYLASNEKLGQKNLAKLQYILHADFDQKTERASLIIQMMDQITDYKLRCVFMSHLIDYLDRELLRMRLEMLITRDEDDYA